LESGAAHSLFVIVPMQRLPETPEELRFHQRAYKLVWGSRNEEELPLRDIRYAAATTSLRSGRQMHGVPHWNSGASSEDARQLREEQLDLLKIDETRFSRLVELAGQVIRDEQLETEGPLDRALALERHFLLAGRYKYSLSLDFARDRELDPIEDFVANHRTGHCEYFAGALVLMLRSQGIPARMIVGYKGGDFNSIGAYYQVRQKHAHAWVEALLPAGAAPEWEIAGEESGGGTWYRLDPTPSSTAVASDDGEDGLLDRVGETFDYVELLWRDYVLSLNAAKQQDTFYEPVSNRALGSLPSWLEGRSVRRFFRRLARQIGLEVDVDQSREASSVFDWRTGTLVIALVLLGVVGLQAVLLSYHLIRRWRIRRAVAGRGAAQRPPRFYLRLQSLLGRMDLRRAAGQTARELAAVAATRLGDQQPQDRTSELPAQIVAAYYRVRFGGAALDSQEQAAIEQALDELTPAIHAVLKAPS
jgi:hypothetical protein